VEEKREERERSQGMGMGWEGLRKGSVRKDGGKEGGVFAHPLLRSFHRYDHATLPLLT